MTANHRSRALDGPRLLLTVDQMYVGIGGHRAPRPSPPPEIYNWVYDVAHSSIDHVMPISTGCGSRSATYPCLF
jgi:hypothetical protein